MWMANAASSSTRWWQTTVSPLAKPEDLSASDYTESAKFAPDTDLKTEANVPYMVKVENCDAATDGTQISFVATQYGSNIVKSGAADG